MSASASSYRYDIYNQEGAGIPHPISPDSIWYVDKHISVTREQELQTAAYKPFGGAKKILYAKEDEVIYDGPAGTGKSRAVLEKLHLCALRYPGMRGLIVRKTRASLTQAALVTFDNFVVPPVHFDTGVVRWRPSDGEYRYSNGSRIVTGGMDKSSKIMSTEYDLIYIQEGTELTEAEFEDLTTRARYGIIPYNQVILDCNPSSATHWAKQRWETNKARRIRSFHEDNPRLFDHNKNEWTEFGRHYLARLDNLSGVRYKRLRQGLWVSAEGMVYEEFDSTVHVVDAFPIPPSWRRFRSVDFGYTNPFVCQWWAMDEDGRLYMYREIYMTRRTVREHSEKIHALSQGENIEVTVCDWDAEDRATLEENGIFTTLADKGISTGIQKLQERLKIQGDGRARIFYLRDSLVEEDLELAESKRPTQTVQEFDSYIWSDRKSKEEPVKVDDHGMDASRYAVMYADGYSASGGIFV